MTVSRARRANKLVVPLLSALALSACTGPREPLSVGMAEQASNIVLGAPPVVVGKTPPVLLPPNALPPQISLPPLVAPMPDMSEPTPRQIPAPPCPTAPPLAQPRVEALRSVTQPPVAATYTYRNEGEFEVTGATAVKGAFPSVATRRVDRIVGATDGSFSFDVAAGLGSTTTRTTYRVVPEQGLTDGGIYIARTEVIENGKTQSVFDPSPDLELVALPIRNAGVVTSDGVDAVSQQTMHLRTRVVGKSRTDACGQLIDVFVLKADGDFGPCPGPIRNPAGGEVDPAPPCVETGDDLPSLDRSGPTPARTTFASEYRLAPQFGGLIVEDRVEVLTDDVLSTTYRKNHAVISMLPRPAGSVASGS